MKKSILFIFLLLFTVQVTYSQKKKKKSKSSISDPIEIKLDNVSFDRDSYMSIMDADNNVIAYYDRFDNKSCAVKSARLYNLKNELIYTLVPIISFQNLEVHFKDTSDVRGHLKTTAKVSGFKVEYESDVSYFQKPFDFEIKLNMGITKVSLNELVKYENKNIMSLKTTTAIGSGANQTPFLASKQFYMENKLDIATWALILHLMKELSFESSKAAHH